MFKGNLNVLRTGITSQQKLGSIIQNEIEGIMKKIVIENDFEIQHLQNVWLNFKKKKKNFQHALFCNKFELILNPAK